MTAQLDLFPVATDKPRISHVDALLQLAFSDAIKDQIVDFANSRPGEWLSWREFSHIMNQYQISFCFGHVLGSLVREERLLDQTHYFGSQYPWEDNFIGSGSRWAALGTEGPRVVVGKNRVPGVQQQALEMAVPA